MVSKRHSRKSRRSHHSRKHHSRKHHSRRVRGGLILGGNLSSDEDVFAPEYASLGGYDYLEDHSLKGGDEPAKSQPELNDYLGSVLGSVDTQTNNVEQAQGDSMSSVDNMDKSRRLGGRRHRRKTKRGGCYNPLKPMSFFGMNKLFGKSKK